MNTGARIADKYGSLIFILVCVIVIGIPVYFFFYPIHIAVSSIYKNIADVHCFEDKQTTTIPQQLSTTSPPTVITAANAHQLKPLRHIGRGTVQALAWSPDGETLALASSIGVWLYASDDLNAEPRLLGGNRAILNNLAFSPDGKLVAAGSEDGTIYLWDFESGQQCGFLQDRVDGVVQIAFSPDGKYLASMDRQRVALWDLSNSTQANVWWSYLDYTWNIAFSLDGKYLAFRDEQGKRLNLWDIQTNRLHTTLVGHTNAIGSALFSPDGRVIVTMNGGYEGTTRIWDTRTGEQLFQYNQPVYDWLFTPEGDLLQSDSGGLWMWDLNTGNRHIFLDEVRTAFHLNFSADSLLVAGLHNANEFSVWNIKTGDEVFERWENNFTFGVSTIFDLKFNPSKPLLVWAVEDLYQIYVWNPKTRDIHNIRGFGSTVYDIVFTNSDMALSIAHDPNVMELLDLTDLTREAEVIYFLSKLSSSSIENMTISRNGHILASGDFDGTIRLWDTQSRVHLTSIDPYVNGVYSLALNDGTLLASGGYDEHVRLWDVTTGRAVATFEGYAGPIWSLAFSANGQWLASGSNDNTARLWDLTNGNEHRILSERKGVAVYDVAFSPDNQWLATAASDGKVQAWDIQTGNEIAAFEYSGWGAKRVAFNADRTLLVSGNNDGAVVIWNMITYEQVAVLSEHTSSVLTIAFSEDGTMMATGGKDGSAILWAID
jgi:WD40 repeat protein